MWVFFGGPSASRCTQRAFWGFVLCREGALALCVPFISRSLVGPIPFARPLDSSGFLGRAARQRQAGGRWWPALPRGKRKRIHGVSVVCARSASFRGFLPYIYIGRCALDGLSAFTANRVSREPSLIRLDLCAWFCRPLLGRIDGVLA